MQAPIHSHVHVATRDRSVTGLTGVLIQAAPYAATALYIGLDARVPSHFTTISKYGICYQIH